MSSPRRTPAAVLAVAAAVLGLALGVPLAQAFFIDTRDAEVAVTADRVANAVSLVTRDREPDLRTRRGYATVAGLRLGGQPLDVAAAQGSPRAVGVLLGWRRDWEGASEPRVFTLTAERPLAAVRISAQTPAGEPSGALIPSVGPVGGGTGPDALQAGERRQIGIAVTGTFPAGPHVALLVLRLEFADGSFLTKRVPVVWFGGSGRPDADEMLHALDTQSPTAELQRLAAAVDEADAAEVEEAEDPAAAADAAAPEVKGAGAKDTPPGAPQAGAEAESQDATGSGAEQGRSDEEPDDAGTDGESPTAGEQPTTAQGRGANGADEEPTGRSAADEASNGGSR